MQTSGLQRQILIAGAVSTFVAVALAIAQESAMSVTDRDAARLYVFAEFHAQPGHGPDVERALRKVIEPTRAEPGCLAIHAFRSVRDDRLFYIHSTWRDEAAFDRHAELPHTVAFVDEVSALIDHPFQTVRTELLG
ncbi:MAG: putative quinol monooxygenase [Thermoanaerobaculia bacterium]